MLIDADKACLKVQAALWQRLCAESAMMMSRDDDAGIQLQQEQDSDMGVGCCADDALMIRRRSRRVFARRAGIWRALRGRRRQAKARADAAARGKRRAARALAKARRFRSDIIYGVKRCQDMRVCARCCARKMMARARWCLCADDGARWRWWERSAADGAFFAARKRRWKRVMLMKMICALMMIWRCRRRRRAAAARERAPAAPCHADALHAASTCARCWWHGARAYMPPLADTSALVGRYVQRRRRRRARAQVEGAADDTALMTMQAMIGGSYRRAARRSWSISAANRQQRSSWRRTNDYGADRSNTSVPDRNWRPTEGNPRLRHNDSSR